MSEATLSSRQAFRGRLLDVHVDEVRLPDGRTAVREWIRHPGAVVMIPVLSDGKLLLIRQFRYPMRCVEIELPAGKIDPGEAPENTVIRELREETGYEAGTIRRIAEIHPAIGFSDERMWLYLAEDLTPSAVARDPDEFLELVPTPLGEAVRMVWTNAITDVKTIIGVLWAERLLSGGRRSV